MTKLSGTADNDLFELKGTYSEITFEAAGGYDSVYLAGNVVVSTLDLGKSSSVEEFGTNGFQLSGTSAADFFDFRRLSSISFPGFSPPILLNGGNDIFFGLLGPAGSRVDGGAGNDKITAGAGSDFLVGGSGDDELFGGDGADELTGGTGADYLDGGNGDDLFFISGDSGRDRFVGGFGDDALALSDNVRVSYLILDAQSGIETIDASVFNISGTSGNDVFDFSGVDLSTADAINLFAGNDKFIGSSDHDEINGGTGNDSIGGGDGDDSLDGQGGEDLIHGDAGNDYIFGGDGADTLHGDTGNDVLSGGSSDDVIFGGAGDDEIYGEGGHNTLYGGIGDDTFNISGIADNAFSGDDGYDTVYLSSNSAVSRLILDKASGVEELNFGAFGWFDPFVITGTAGNDVFDLSGIEVFKSQEAAISLGGGSDKYVGAQIADYVDGGVGNDTINGGGGEDVLIGGEGNDSLIGGTGGDFLDGGSGNDRALYTTAGSGVTVSLLNTALNKGDARGDSYDSIENISGSIFNDFLYADNSSNVINAGAGNDLIKSYAGNDTVSGGAGSDIFVFNSSLNATTNVDTITDFATVDTIQLENGIFTALTTLGTLGPGSFKNLALGAIDSNDRILYSASGKLYYDADGSGNAFGLVKFAELSGVPNLTAADFFVI